MWCMIQDSARKKMQIAIYIYFENLIYYHQNFCQTPHLAQIICNHDLTQVGY